MRLSQAFPSNYLKAADLQGRTINVVIDRVVMEDIGDDHKPVIYFRGKEKGLVCNKTNGNNIAAAFGDEMDEWPGKTIALYPTMVDFQGKSVEAVRVKPVRAAQANGHQPQAAAAPAAPAPTAPVRYTEGAPLDDEVPF